MRERPGSTASRDGDTWSDGEQSHYQKGSVGNGTSHGKGDHVVLGKMEEYGTSWRNKVGLNRVTYISFPRTRDARSPVNLYKYFSLVAL